MIPILFKKYETEFDNNGLGRLRDCISCTVVEERNGIYECDFEYPVIGAHFNQIQLGMTIGVTHDETGDIQPFDIVSVTRPINGIVSFHCVHISYRQSYLTVWDSEIYSLADAFTALSNAEPNNPFTYTTNKTSTGYLAIADGRPKTVKQFLGGVEGSILDTYGGEYKWDRFKVELLEARGEVKSFKIRYGTNMIDYTDDSDLQETFSSCVPFWSSNEVTVIGNRVDASEGTATGRGECVPLDLTEKFDEQPTTTQLEEFALSYMNTNKTSLPTQNIQVSFVRLQDFEEHESFSNLLECNLCDSIQVIFPMYNTTATFKIVKTTFNVLEDRYDSMELGSLSTTLSEALGIQTPTNTTSSKDEADYVVEEGTSGIWSYRKWVSGIAECWGTEVKSIAVTTSSASYGGYRSAQITSSDFPFTFTTKPSISLNIESNGAWVNNVTGTTTDNIKFYLSAGASNAATNRTLHYHAIGRWK